MRLFIELYLDEDMDVQVATLLRARGFTAISTREAGQLGKDDADQLQYASAHGYAFITHNRADFEALARTYFTEGREHFGIIIAVRHSPQEIVRRLLLILNAVTADEMRNAVRYI